MLIGYLVASALVCGVGSAVAVAAGLAPGMATLSAATAWVVQSALAVPLVRALDAERNAVRSWAFGMFGRAMALFVALVLARSALVPGDAAIVFGLSLSALIILEAAWLAVIPATGGTGNTTRE